MYIVGITGGTGAGKTTAIRSIVGPGAKALDCDAVYHELLLNNSKMKAEISNRFNNVTTDGKIDRQKLGKLVWNNPDSLSVLNKITHKYINDEIDRRLEQFQKQGIKTILIDAIALIESGQGKKCDVLICVTAPEEKRIARIMERDNLTEEQAKKRINAQKPDGYYRENCDYVLENIYETSAEFEKKCIEFFKDLKGKNQWGIERS